MHHFPAKISHFAHCFFGGGLKMSEEIKSTGFTGQNLGSNVPAVGGSTPTSSTHPMDEVFRVNQLLQIEDLNSTCQLKQAVSNFRV